MNPQPKVPKFHGAAEGLRQPSQARSPALIAILLLTLTASGCGGGGGGSTGGTVANTAATTNTTASNTATTTPATTPVTTPAATPAPVSAPPASDPETTTQTETTDNTEPTTPADPSGTEIKLLVLLSEGVAGLYADPQLRVMHLVNFSNLVLAQSGVDLTLTLAQLENVSYPDGLDTETALNDLTGATHSSLADVASWRTAAGADLVVLMRPYANDGRCGIAWIGGYLTNGDMSNSSSYGYSVVSPNCSDYTLLHELGHNLGLGHSREENASAGSFDYGRGYGEDGNFATVMASPSFYSAPRVSRLASPLTDCLGAPCGVIHTDPVRGADAVFALQQTMDQVAAYEP